MELSEIKFTPKQKRIIDELGFHNCEDILSYYPYRYEEYVYKNYKDWHIDETVVFDGELISYPSTFRYGKRSTTKFKVLFQDNELTITIFNRPWIRNLELNSKIVIIGKYEGSNKVVATNYYTKDINTVIGINPIYSLKDSFNQNEIKKLISTVLDSTYSVLNDYVPSDLIKSHGLISYKDAIYNVHKPKSRELLQKSLSRLKYEEFLRFYVSLNLLNDRSGLLKENKIFDREKIKDLISSIPFSLTEDQSKAVEEILKDLESTKATNRLLQGDVGCGKTIVAVIALYANYLSGYRGCLMAPTEILSKQHYEDIKSILEPLGLRICNLYSSSNNISVLKNEISNGDYDIIIGTHALFSDDVFISNLGLVITDEQHRFGVNQRKKLREKGENVDFLMMSATPIPRTLASSIYGDMDISTIESMPSDRKGCKTYLIKKNSIVDVLDKITNKLDEGRQVYIVAAAIEKSDSYNAKDVNNLFKSLQDAFPKYKLAILHGKMNTLEKDEVMNKFKNNEIQILVSTTVVEVGVNVKNATVMVVYDADRFGLSQLHQLRGRIQRSNYEGECYLLTSSKEENVLKRLEVLVNSNNGFEISYEDLKLRGPGDILGTRQSGLPSFILGNFIEDSKFINGAKADADMIVNNTKNEEYSAFLELIRSKINTYID